MLSTVLFVAAALSAGSRDATLAAFLREHFLREVRVETMPAYRSAWADLNGDGRNEALAYIQDRSFCGSGGCNLLIATPTPKSFRLVGRVPVTWPPIRVLESRTHGWRDIAVTVAGGGATPGEVRLRFDGRRYASNPTVLPAEPIKKATPGRILIAAPSSP